MAMEHRALRHSSLLEVYCLMHIKFIMKKKFKKIAIIHDVFIEKGGAERVLASLVSMFPDADIFIPLLSDENKS